MDFTDSSQSGRLPRPGLQRIETAEQLAALPDWTVIVYETPERADYDSPDTHRFSKAATRTTMSGGFSTHRPWTTTKIISK